MHYTLIFFLLLASFSMAQDVPRFESQLIDGQVAIGYGLAIGDVDGDRKPDILLADKKQFVWYRNGDWKRFVMVENLTESDNVCIAARDIDGDGRVEVAVGAQWNPGETSDTLKSGSVHYLIRPIDPTGKWKPVKLHHEPTTHRMQWVKAGSKYHLVVLPLHGRGNKGGEGAGVRVFAYEKPSDPEKPWRLQLLDASMHLTHNLDVVADERGRSEVIYIGGKEGVKSFVYQGGRWSVPKAEPWVVNGRSFGEIRSAGADAFITGIEPMHGKELTVYSRGKGAAWNTSGVSRTVLTADFNQGHGLAVADVLGSSRKEIVAGWREPDKDSKVGVKLFVAEDEAGTRWHDYWIDDNGMACEDLKVADLNGDGKPEVIAAGRATRNLKIYWNNN